MITGVHSRSRDIVVLSLAAAAAWVGVTLALRVPNVGMGATMGLPFIAFIGAWTLMMAAMMLPAVSPVASLYIRSVGSGQAGRLLQFGAGYLIVWALVGLPAFGLATVVDSLAMNAPSAGRWAVVGVLLAVAAYQVTPLKAFCLKRCRSPLSQLIRYASLNGALRDLRAGSHHGLYCAGCCWPMMLLLVAVGTMNLVAMLALTILIAAEKLLPHGQAITQAIAVLAVVAALIFALSPQAFSLLTSAS